MRPKTCLLYCAGILSAANVDAAPFDYKWPGIHLKESGFTADIMLRAQLRITSTKPHDSDFEEADEITEEEINRARFKMGGQLGLSWFDYYTGYDFPSSRLLDLKFTLTSPGDEANLRFGQWKAPFNGERIDSSGRQQFVDRSIANKWFTLDRQRGISLFGRLAPGSHLDSSYHFAVLE